MSGRIAMAEQTYPATVLSVTDLTPNVRQLVLLPAGKKLTFEPGQWISLKLPVGPNPPLNRAYSMAAPASPSGELTLVFDRVPEGIGSTYLYDMRPGSELLFSGPHGRFTLPPPESRERCLIGRYTGLVPLRCMLKALYAQRDRSAVLLIGVAPAETELLYHEEFLALAVTHPSFRYLPLVAAREEEAVALTISMLTPVLEAQPHVVPLLCGTKAFVRPLRAFFMEAGYDRKEVKVETYD
jgi:ferredoxin-NADP reductase